MAQARLHDYFSKRPRPFTSPTRVTPVRPTKRVSLLQDIMEEIQSTNLDDDDLVSREEQILPIDSLCASAELQLSFSEANPRANPSSESESTLCSHWSTDELQALVQFVLENGKGDVWATHQRANWSAAATFIQRKVGTAHVRTRTYLSYYSSIYCSQLVRRKNILDEDWVWL